jgi:hypothetical protein
VRKVDRHMYDVCNDEPHLDEKTLDEFVNTVIVEHSALLSQFALAQQRSWSYKLAGNTMPRRTILACVAFISWCMLVSSDCV